MIVRRDEKVRLISRVPLFEECSQAELARIAGVHDEKKLTADPAFALGNLFGRLPLSRTPLLKALATEAKNRDSSK